MKTVVVRNIPRPDKAVVDTLGKLGVSTTHEAMGRVGLMKPYMRPIYASAEIAGPAVTVLAQPGDNWMIHVAVEQCREGDVLVVGCTTDNTDGMFGELLATSLRARGVAGPQPRRDRTSSTPTSRKVAAIGACGLWMMTRTVCTRAKPSRMASATAPAAASISLKRS